MYSNPAARSDSFVSWCDQCISSFFMVANKLFDHALSPGIKETSQSSIQIHTTCIVEEYTEVGYIVGFGKWKRAENPRVYRLFFWCDRRDLNLHWFR